MKLILEIGGASYRVDLSHPIDLSIPLRFDGDQPSAFGAPPASSKVLGDTRKGSAVNWEELHLTPHGNGTHTECIGHIASERIPITDLFPGDLVPSTLRSTDRLPIPPTILEGARPEFRRGFILRTLPNGAEKLRRHYGDKSASYVLPETMAEFARAGVEHLVLDLPSADPLHDEGRLLAHRAFWDTPRSRRTITELAYIPDEIPDGEYLLNLQIAPFVTDAAPSRPLLYRLIQESMK